MAKSEITGLAKQMLDSLNQKRLEIDVELHAIKKRKQRLKEDLALVKKIAKIVVITHKELKEMSKK